MASTKERSLNVRLVIEYHGGYFYGFQWQPNLKTVQSELERVLSIVLKEPIVPIYPSGRTDSGVHARRQVINFFCREEPDLNKLIHAVSSLLKGELGVLRADIVDASYNSRRSARSKQYSYWILNRRAPPTFHKGLALHLGKPLDVERMKSEAKSFVGTHDFSAFRGANCSAETTVREIFRSEVKREGDFVVFEVEGSGFLQHMVRIMTGTLIEFGNGNFQDRSMKEILETKKRSAAGPTAPSHGLYLDWVETKEGERL